MNLVHKHSVSGIIICGNVINNESVLIVYYEDNLSATEGINNKVQEDNSLIGIVRNNVGFLISL